MSNTETNSSRDEEYLASLRKTKISIITENEEYRHFKLNGTELLEFIEGTHAHSAFYDGVQNIMGSYAISEKNIYSIDELANFAGKLKDRFKRAHRGQFEKHALFQKAREAFALVEAAATKVEENRRNRFAEGLTTFEDLAFLFEEDDHVTWTNGDEILVGGYFKSAEIKRSFFGASMIFNVEVIVSVGGEISRATVQAGVNAFSGTTEIAKLPITKLEKGSKAETELVERGAIFASVSTGTAAYVDYTGMLIKPSYWSDAEFRADGRIMVDPESMARIDSDTFDKAKRRIMSQNRYGRDDDDDAVKIEKVDEKDYFACSPYVLGFSFRAKTWGLMLVSGIKPIAWARDAFERLVLETKTKKRVRALVQNSSDSFSDIIGGKGGGCVFLLHGEPGQGKTLTAETVAEDLKRPLYSISVGELGTNPDQLEKRLREILDLATIWNAVLLLDEADIFLEARDEKDVLRNAMVGVFLRLLEYHQGVLFLTTNRVRNIDPAFYSRISVAIAFSKADAEKRFKVWTNLLGAAGIKISEADISALAKSDLNGRQIKNVIRTASTLAKLDGEPVTFNRLQEEIEEATRFERDMNKEAQPAIDTPAPARLRAV